MVSSNNNTIKKVTCFKYLFIYIYIYRYIMDRQLWMAYASIQAFMAMAESL